MRHHRLVSLLVVLAAPAAAQVVPIGGEIQINSYTTGSQESQHVATDGSGNAIVVWRSSGSAGTDSDVTSVQARRYDPTGAPLGGQFQVNAYTTGYQGRPAVAADGAGNFIVVWASDQGAGTDTSFGSVQGQRFDGTGSPVGSQFQVNSYTTNVQTEPAVAMDVLGNFVVVWRTNQGDGTDPLNSIQGQRFDSAGLPVGSQFQVNSYTTGDVSEVAVDVQAIGASFVVAWESEYSGGSDTDDRSIQARVFDNFGNPTGPQFQVNSYTTDYQYAPKVSIAGVGPFVIVWDSAGSVGSDSAGSSIQGQRYDAVGTPVGGQFQVNSYTTANQFYGDVGTDDVGNFVVAWQGSGSTGTDADQSSIHAQRYDAAGLPLGGEIQVNTYTTSAQGGEPALAAEGNGNFVVAWRSGGSAGNDTDGFSIQAQRLAVARTILGKKILVKDPTSNEIQRVIVALGKETATDIGSFIDGNPVANGAILRVITKGTVDSDQTYVLDAAGWATTGTTGFRYSGPTGGDGDPVKKVIVKRTPGGTALLKVLLKGNTGTQSLDVVPPNAGDEGGLALTLNGGATYCVAFGGSAGGSEVKDDAQLWKILNAGAEGCPTP